MAKWEIKFGLQRVGADQTCLWQQAGLTHMPWAPHTSLPPELIFLSLFLLASFCKTFITSESVFIYSFLVCVHIGVCMHVFMPGRPEDNLQCHSLAWNLPVRLSAGWPVSPCHPPVCISPVLGLQEHGSPHPALLHGLWNGSEVLIVAKQCCVA